MAEHNMSFTPEQPLQTASRVTSVSVEDLFSESLTPDSSSTDLSPSSMVFPGQNEECFPLPMGETWSLCMQQQQQQQPQSHPVKVHDQPAIMSLGDISSQDDYYFDSSPLITGENDHHMVEPKKARRQAQNRAAQRAFRERKEKYIQELEEKTTAMSKRIANLESDRKRLEGALRVARAEADTLRSLPSRFTSHTTSTKEKSQIACKVDGPSGRHAVVLTLEIGVQDVQVCPQEGRKDSPMADSPRFTKAVPDGKMDAE